MARSKPTTKPGRASLWIFIILLVQLLLILVPIPFLRFALPTGLQNLLTLLQSAATVMMTLDGLLFLGAALLLGIAWWRHENARYVRLGMVYAGLSLALNPFLLLWAIAGTETWFVGTVPIEQRLVSQNETIRTKAQQELLGLSSEAKQQVTQKLIPELTEENRYVRKWAAISVALMGSAAQDAIPALLPGVSAPEKDVAEAFRVALSEIGAPDPSQLPTLLQGLGDAQEAVQCESATTIARMGSAAASAVPLLIARIKENPNLPTCVGRALAELKDQVPEVSPAVIRLLKESDERAQRNAAYTLSLFKTKTAEQMDALFAYLAQDGARALRRMAARALALSDVPEPGVLPTLAYSVRRSRDSAVRLRAVELLRHNAWPLAEAIPVLARIVEKDPLATMRLEAVRWLAEVGPAAQPAAPALMEALGDHDAAVRFIALQALRASGARAHGLAQRLAHAQRDADPQVRCEAAKQLTEIGAADRVFVPMLVRDLKSGAGAAPCAADALGMAGHFNGDVVPALVVLLNEPDRERRSQAARLLMELGPRAKPALPALARAQRDAVPGAEMAIRALRETIQHPSHRRKN